MATRTWNEPDKSDIMVEQVNDPAPRQLEPAVTAVSDDEVAREAIGTDNLPPGYFRSAKFLGTLMAVSLMNISLYTGYVLPVRKDPPPLQNPSQGSTQERLLTTPF